jgi:hypothetical protein
MWPDPETGMASSRHGAAVEEVRVEQTLAGAERVARQVSFAAMSSDPVEVTPRAWAHAGHEVAFRLLEAALMAEHHHHSTLRIVRAVPVRQDAPAEATPAPSRGLSNYELLERRSRELAEQRARGGLGTSQAPDAAAPLLFPKQKTGDAAARQDENDTPTEPPPAIAAPRGMGRM